MTLTEDQADIILGAINSCEQESIASEDQLALAIQLGEAFPKLKADYGQLLEDAVKRMEYYRKQREQNVEALKNMGVIK